MRYLLGRWLPLGAPLSEVRLDFTLPTGQSFRWRRTGEQEYTGVVHRRVVRARLPCCLRCRRHTPRAEAGSQLRSVHLCLYGGLIMPILTAASTLEATELDALATQMLHAATGLMPQKLHHCWNQPATVAFERCPCLCAFR